MYVYILVICSKHLLEILQRGHNELILYMYTTIARTEETEFLVILLNQLVYIGKTIKLYDIRLTIIGECSLTNHVIGEIVMVHIHRTYIKTTTLTGTHTYPT